MADFLVVGNHAVDGTDPGGIVTVDDEQRAYWLQRAGHLLPVPEQQSKKSKAKKADD